jgi:hypothetical protein
MLNPCDARLQCKRIAVAMLLLAALPGAPCAADTKTFVPDGRLRPDDYTILMAVDARRPSALVPLHAGGHGKFPLTHWTAANQLLEWDVDVPCEDAYAVNVLVRHQDRQTLRLEVEAAAEHATGTLAADMHAWTRLPLDAALHLPAGKCRIALRANAEGPTATFQASVFSLELVRPPVRARLHAAALELRADTTWMQRCRYGLMCHWTSQSQPRSGAPLPYAEAVERFNVERFAQQAADTGAGFVVFTTAHAQQYFPAPLAALHGILPGRTANRDLVADLAAALGRHNIRLILYYHLGAASDPQWLAASGFWETDTRAFFDHWTAIVGEAGHRYGKRLAGWWFDDGAVTYYYRSAPWQRLATAAKAGYPARLVAFNPWDLPPPTEFHDLFCGEGFGDPSVGGLLRAGGDGHFHGGTYDGLQASACLITERDWGHFTLDRPIAPPRWNAPQLAALLNGFVACKNVPIFNLEITQDGQLSPATVEVFARAAKTLDQRPGERQNP